MAQRGRRSAAALTLVTGPVESIPRQRAPAELTPEEAKVWDAIVAGEPADWFSASTRPIRAQYCRHIIAARHTAELLQALQASACRSEGHRPKPVRSNAEHHRAARSSA
jgi:hypothetical protein